MDLTTNYLGLRLDHPLIVGASPMVDDLDQVRRLEGAGAAAIVMRSLFEEQISREIEAAASHSLAHDDAYSEALSYLTDPVGTLVESRAWFDQLRAVRKAVKIPVIASLNGTTAHGWVKHAREMEEAGAAALELNIYLLSTRAEDDAAHIEDRVVEVAEAVLAQVKIPVAVKLSPFYSSLPNLVRRLGQRGVSGVVLFNRFLQPDIDVEALEAVPTLRLSDSGELLLRLRWLAILHGREPVQLALSGGVHTPVDAVKGLMAGADVLQVVSALLKNGPEHIGLLRDGLEGWMREHEYESLDQLRGSMSLLRCPDPEAFERANYMRVLHTWRPGR